jgi:class 3 adenylate cyclase
VARLTASERAKLPDSAFAYIDARGQRRLPINDESHVRNALSRFDQVVFEDDAARERARKRLLNAAKRYGIVPVGFITSQLDSERTHAAAGRVVIELGRLAATGELEDQLRTALRDPSLAVLYWSDAAGSYVDAAGKPVALPGEDDGRAVTVLEREGRAMTALVHNPSVLDDPDLAKTVLAAVRFVVERERLSGEVEASATDAATLPTGFVTFLLTDIEGSTKILTRLGDGYAELLNDVRAILRRAVLSASGREVDVRADELFAVFDGAGDAVQAAIAMQRALGAHAWPDALDVRVRAGVHSGSPTLTETGYIGLSVHTTARVCAAAHGGQIVVSGETREAVGGSAPDVEFRDLGSHRLAGLSRAVALFQVEAEGLATDFPPPAV